MRTDAVRRRGPQLDGLFARYHRRAFVSPDPLELLYAYDDVRDREVAGLLAAGYAYGQVKTIVADAGRVLDAMGRSPADFVRGAPESWLAAVSAEGRHRWTTPGDLAALLRAMRVLCARHGSLEAAFLAVDDPAAADVLPALRGWCRALREAGAGARNSLLPDAAKASASKRLHLYLRWMVRCDEVDPGGWTGVSPARLLVPLDVHMHRICRGLGFTRRRQANLAAAQEATAAFRVLAPDDPVRYDFSLTRAGMRGEL